VCFLGITCALVSTNYLDNFANVVLIVWVDECNWVIVIPCYQLQLLWQSIRVGVFHMEQLLEFNVIEFFLEVLVFNFV
jgi:hypothetical protein